MECELIVFTCDEGGTHWQQICELERFLKKEDM